MNKKGVIKKKITFFLLLGGHYPPLGTAFSLEPGSFENRRHSASRKCRFQEGSGEQWHFWLLL